MTGPFADLGRRLDTAPVAQWSVSIRSLDGLPVFEHRSEVVRRTASVGKILLLIDVARQIVDGDQDPEEPLTRTTADAVADSGLWQHLRTPALPVMDLCALVGAVSDNLATNVLLRRFGLAAAQRTADALGLTHTALHDRVRDRRRPADPVTLSTGTAAELSRVFAELVAPAVLEPPAANLVLGWLALNADLSQVASAWGLDPLAHLGPDLGITVRNKTGTDTGIRADVGIVRGASAAVAFAVLAEWSDDTPQTRTDVLQTMGDIGRRLRTFVSGP